MQKARDAKAAKGLFQLFLKAGGKPTEISADKLRGYGHICRQGAYRSLIPGSSHNTPTIEQSFHTNLLGFVSEACVTSNRSRRRSDSWKPTPPTSICSICTGIRFADDTLSSFCFGHSPLGMRLQPHSLGVGVLLTLTGFLNYQHHSRSRH